ncbi:CST complex subunit TEN1 isoform X3 [Rana temporaria]|uniref:CST complex subunit TEN1 isoform X3 n=1 Tax=Rana temporaria TaxID=8407 RepID=UPI001AAC4BFC|nr:CST complex subunit TEN1 isoform X3 [Rana temporaria]
MYWENRNTLSSYDFTQSEAVLTAQHSAAQHKLHVNTKFVEPFSPRLGSYYMALGELESGDGFIHSYVCALQNRSIKRKKNFGEIWPRVHIQRVRTSSPFSQVF